MSDNSVCPTCGKDYENCLGLLSQLIPEIDRLRSALEKAEADRDKYRGIRDVVWNKVLSLRSDLQSSRDEKERIYQEWFRMYEQRNEARKWARRMLREATIAQQNHVSAIQREMITGSKLFDRETRLTTLAKELGRVQRERDAEVERAVEAEAEVEQLKAALLSVYNRGHKTSAAVAVAEVCDTELDRSGRLLGEIREASRKLKGYA